MTFKKIATTLLASSLLLGVTVTAQPTKKHVMTTIYPVYYLAKRIGGDLIEVEQLLSANQDAHDYESSAKDAAKVQQSDVFIYQDDEMEHFVSDMVRLLDTKKTTVVESTDGITLLAGDDDHDHDHEHEDEDEAEEHDHHEDHEDHEEHDHHHEFDPHTWTNPMIYLQQAHNVKDALIQADPDNQAAYEANFTALEQDLKQLDSEFKEALSKRSDRTFVVQHAAFGYLAHAYNLEQVAITGISTTQEPSANALAHMQDFVKDHHVTTIYVDPSLNPAIAEVVAKASGATLKPLSTLENVSGDQDYLTLMRDNLASLTQ